MKTTNTDLRELLDRLSVYVEPKTIKEFEGVCRFYIKRDYLPRTEAISRKDAVLRVEVEKIKKKRMDVGDIGATSVTYPDGEIWNQSNRVGWNRCVDKLKDLLTKVDKPNKE